MLGLLTKWAEIMNTLQEQIEQLPTELRNEAELFIAALLERSTMRSAEKAPTFRWIGALKNIDDPRSSVEIQHAILDMWIDNVST